MALSANRNTKDLGFDVIPHFISIPVTDNQHIYAGSLVGLDSAGRARPMTVSATTPVCIGRAEAEADNTVTGHSAGGINVLVKTGVFPFDNDTGTPITNASRGKICYAKDDYTVTGDATLHAIAGIVIDVPASGNALYGQVLVMVCPSPISGSDATVLAAALLTTTGGAMVGLTDAGGYFTTKTVEAALQQLGGEKFDTVVAVTPASVNGANLAAGKTLKLCTTNKAVYIEDVAVQVNGSTAWDTLASLTVQDDNTTPTTFGTINVAQLGANAVTRLGMTGFLPAANYAKTGKSVTNCNIVIKADANSNGNGSSLNVRIRGRIA
jgi:hypothetical protein